MFLFHPLCGGCLCKAVRQSHVRRFARNAVRLGYFRGRFRISIRGGGANYFVAQSTSRPRSFMVSFVLSCYLSLILKHFDIKRNKRTSMLDQNLWGTRLLYPCMDPPLHQSCRYLVVVTGCSWQLRDQISKVSNFSLPLPSKRPV